MRKFSAPTIIMNAKAATGVGTAFNVKAFQHIVVGISAPALASLTFKFQGSMGKSMTSTDVPDFAAAQSISNHWDYISAYDLQNPGSLIAGDTGVTLNDDTEASNTRMYLINVDALEWLNIDLTAFTDGSLSAFVIGYSDQQ